ncbi:MAG: hypothetical protein HC932_02875 [Thermales bacterium]|nr:hypothetical protein [Thermales bacterium]
MFERNKIQGKEQNKLNPKEIFRKVTITSAGILTAFVTTFAKPEIANANNQNQESPTPSTESKLLELPSDYVVPTNLEINPNFNHTTQNNLPSTDYEFNTKQDIQINQNPKPPKLELNSKNHIHSESSVKKSKNPTQKKIRKNQNSLGERIHSS